MSTKPKRPIKHRNMKGNSFYKIRHQFDELPLDPVVPFIQEKIRKSTTMTSTTEEPFNKFFRIDNFICIAISTEQMRSNRGVNFANDLDLYTNEVNECRRQILTNVINNKLDHHQPITTENGRHFNWTALLKENYGKYILYYNFDIDLKK